MMLCLTGPEKWTKQYYSLEDVMIKRAGKVYCILKLYLIMPYKSALITAYGELQ